MAAAVASGGISIDSILQAAVRLLREAGRRRRPLEFGAGAGTLARRLHADGYDGPITGADHIVRPFRVIPRRELPGAHHGAPPLGPQADLRRNGCSPAALYVHRARPRAATHHPDVATVHVRRGTRAPLQRQPGHGDDARLRVRYSTTKTICLLISCAEQNPPNVPA